MTATAQRRGTRRFLLGASAALVAMIVAAWALSFWRSAGRRRADHQWVPVPASGMQELHTTDRLLWAARGRVEAVRTSTLQAVIPLGSPAAEGQPAVESAWVWEASAPARVRSWDDRWHLSRWDHWRLGDLGWYETTGGGATSRVLSVPLWLVALVAGIPCWRALAVRCRRGHRRRRGLCPACGYSRGGIAAPTPCPECGATEA